MGEEAKAYSTLHFKHITLIIISSDISAPDKLESELEPNTLYISCPQMTEDSSPPFIEQVPNIKKAEILQLISGFFPKDPAESNPDTALDEDINSYEVLAQKHHHNVMYFEFLMPTNSSKHIGWYILLFT